MIISRFEEQVERFAEKPAVITENIRYTYRELNNYANCVADAILKKDALSKNQGTIVGLLFEHSADMIVGVFGTLKANKTYVPLDITYPENRLAYMLEDSGACLLLTNNKNITLAEKLVEKIRDKDKNRETIKILDIDTLRVDVSVPVENIGRKVSGEALAYILYTSGSTGKPKGVMQNHENVCHYSKNWARIFSITGEDRMTLLSAFSHDGSIPDIYGSLLNGAALYPYNVLTRGNVGDLLEWLVKENITIWHSVPTLYRYFVDSLKHRDIVKDKGKTRDRVHFPNLRYIILGGEQVREHDIDMFKTFFPNAVFANIYGQTESTANSIWLVKAGDPINKILIGDPLENTQIFIVDENDEIVEEIGVGEIVVASKHIALGYWKNKENTENVFSNDPQLGRLYSTGDLGRLAADGSIEFIGRKDSQVKLRGFRIETGEIETTLLKYNFIKEAVVAAKTDKNGNVHLCAYIVPASPASSESEAAALTVPELRKHLSTELPEHMIPSYFIELEKMPLTPSGKIDRLQLPEPEPIRPRLGATYVAPENSIEKKVTEIWEEVLYLDKVGVTDNFFDLGGTSIDILNVVSRLYDEYQKEVPVVALFRYPTVRSFVEYFTAEVELEPAPPRQTAAENEPQEEIAVIGMAGRFPGAANVDQFWENLLKGLDTISRFSYDELDPILIGDSEIRKHPDYVGAKGVVEDIEFFDAAFFGYTPFEARIMDPQLRILHECAWEALENAGYNPDDYDGLIGLYAGNAETHYWKTLTYLNDITETGFLSNNYTTIVSYRLNLKGPSFVLKTACSTSLVAVHLACRGLINRECHIALAGALSILAPSRDGYLYKEGLIYSRDGYCRTFDVKASGTVFGNGAGLVVLKRYEDALADGDSIHAVIKGTAINNDGKRKVGLASPSVEGQAEVIGRAFQNAGLSPESIGYVEAHGTATILGDPVEMEALRLAFNTTKRHYCRIGSVKTNVGHLNTAAGIAALIKTILCLKHKTIPASLHFETPNPKIDFENSPFVVNTELTEWKPNEYPRRAGVSAFGIGGTNAHIILEETPPTTSSSEAESRPLKMLMLSAGGKTALEKTTENLAKFLEQNPGTNLADVAYTLQVGRKHFKLRKMILCSDADEAVSLLRASGESSLPETGKTQRVVADEEDRPVVFMFPGQGAQYVNMGLGLYQTEPVFRDVMDRCFDILKSIKGFDLKEVIYPPEGENRTYRTYETDGTDRTDRTDEEEINQTEITQPMIFVIEYALATLLMSWGIRPYVMIGHSIGEYAAACLSGVLSLEDTLALVALRGKLMQKLPGGSMLSVPLPEDELSRLMKESENITTELSVAAVNTTAYCVVSGPHEAIDAFEEILKEKKIDSRRLHTSHAFHSAMMDPILDEFEEKVREVPLNEPGLPYISNASGKWITVEEATDPHYWAKHVRGTVRFADGLPELFKLENVIFLEVGPGRTLSSFVTQHKDKKPGHLNLNLVRHPKENLSDSHFLLGKIGRLWLNGKNIDWQGFYAGEKRCRIPLPAYPFQRQRYWFDGISSKLGFQSSIDEQSLRKNPEIAEWFYAPAWQTSISTSRRTRAAEKTFQWLFFIDRDTLTPRLVEKLRAENHDIVIAKPGTVFSNPAEGEYTLNPAEKKDYEALLKELSSIKKIPQRIVHAWNVTGTEEVGQEPGFYSLVNLAQAIGGQRLKNTVQLTVLTDGMQAVTGSDIFHPRKSPIAGVVQVIPKEYNNIHCRSIDILLPEPQSSGEEALIKQLLDELSADVKEPLIAFRNGLKWAKTYEPYPLEKSKEDKPRLKDRGVYLITGGLGGIGLVLARHLAKTVKAKLILTGRSAFPDPETWDQWLASHQQDDSTSLKIRKVRELQKEGAEVLVFSADTADIEQMRECISLAEQQFGKINGVIHAAGIPDGGLIQLRTPEASRSVLSPKIEGTLVLDSLLKETPLDFFILCSSISAVTAPLGQVAYCAANSFLDNFAHYKTLRDNTFTVSVNWDGWQEVGMAVDAMKKLSGHTETPGTADVQEDEHPGVDHPLFHHREVLDSGQVIYVSYFRGNREWILDEHRILGKPAVPGTSYLEMARAAISHHTQNSNVELREFLFLTPMVVGEEEEKEVRTIIRKNGGDFTISFISRVSDGEDRWLEHCRGKAVCPAAAEPRQYTIKEIEAACSEREIIYNPENFVPTPGAITFGPRWNSLRKIKTSKEQALGTLELLETFAPDCDSYKLHPALLDVGNITLRRGNADENAYLPLFYKRLTIKGDVPASVYFHVKGLPGNKHNAETLRYNISILDEKGTELVDIEEYTVKMVRLDSRGMERFDGDSREASPVGSLGELSRPLASFISIDNTGAGKTEEKPAPSYRNDMLKDAISPVEGVDVFTRILGGDGFSQVVVSTRDLTGRIQKARIKPGDEKKPGEDAQKTDISIPKHARPELSTDYIAPVTRTEKMLAPIWEELLGIEQVGIYDDFFELGGDSLKAVNFGGRIQRELGVEVPISEFFTRPNIKLLAGYIEEAGGTGEFYAVEPVEKKEYYPLTPAQKRLYIMQQMTPDSTSYNIPSVVPMEGPIDLERVEHAFRRLIERHEILRTSFAIAAKNTVQRIHSNVEFKIEHYEAGENNSRDEVNTIIRDFVRPFDLSTAPLLRVGIVQSGPSKFIFIIDMHHSIADAFSQEILFREFSLLDRGEPLPPLKLQYRDYSEWRDSEQVKENIEKQGEYWQEHFKGDIPVLNLPTDYPRPEIQSFEGNTVGFFVAPEITAALKQIANEKKATLYMVLLAIYNIFLSKLSGQTDIVVGTDAAGRSHSDLEHIIGMFVNTLAIKNSPAGEKTFDTFLQEVKGNTLKAFENQDYPFEDLVEHLSIQRDPGRNPLFDVFLSFMDSEVAPSEMHFQKKSQTMEERYIYENTTAKFDLLLSGILDKGSLFFAFEYRTRLFREETIRKFIGYFQELAASIIRNPNAPIWELEIVSDEQEQGMLKKSTAEESREYAAPSSQETKAAFDF